MVGDLYDELCSIENLELAFSGARKGKTQKQYVIEFEANLKKNISQLRNELLLQCYKPMPLKTFILRDPKTRKISKSDFRDRVVHHALCNVIEPFFDKTFIYDSYANRIGKGTFAAIKRFDYFKSIVSKNGSGNCFVLKADIKHYFDTVDHNVLVRLLENRISDARIIWLVRRILENHKTEIPGKGMPLGNLTSQFFANVYLNELDQFVKHHLKTKYYIRYVDDFVILHGSKELLEVYKKQIDSFIRNELCLQLHPDKSKVLNLQRGISFLGFRIFYYHKLVRKKNTLRFEKRLQKLKTDYLNQLIDREKAVECFEGWLAYIAYANTHKYRQEMIRFFNEEFKEQEEEPVTTKKHLKFQKKTDLSTCLFSVQKTLKLYKQGLSISQIAKIRGLKESTIWSHIANLIEHSQISI